MRYGVSCWLSVGAGGIRLRNADFGLRIGNGTEVTADLSGFAGLRRFGRWEDGQFSILNRRPPASGRLLTGCAVNEIVTVNHGRRTGRPGGGVLRLGNIVKEKNDVMPKSAWFTGGLHFGRVNLGQRGFQEARVAIRVLVEGGYESLSPRAAWRVTPKSVNLCKPRASRVAQRHFRANGAFGWAIGLAGLSLGRGGDIEAIELCAAFAGVDFEGHRPRGQR